MSKSIHNKGGRSKKGYYKGIFCGSTYELCWVIYSLDHQIHFERFLGIIKGTEINYIPDFLLSDNQTIIEIKGYEHNDTVKKKTALAESKSYIVQVLRKDDLQDIFNYVKETYNTNNFATLYDDYKPAFTYTCNNCLITYTTDRKTNANETFCTRECSGFYRKKQNDPAKRHNPELGKYKRKLTKVQALEIYYDVSERTYEELANAYNTSKNAVWWIKSKKSYKWIHNK